MENLQLGGDDQHQRGVMLRRVRRAPPHNALRDEDQRTRLQLDADRHRQRVKASDLHEVHHEA